MSNASVPLARSSIARGCGDARTAGAVYLESGLSASGRLELEHFLVDPPVAYQTDQKIGVDFVQDKSGTWHVIDWVGEQHYPYPSDFLEEGRRHGFSRKISRNSQFDKLTADSRLVFVHPRAIVANAPDIHPYLPEHRIKHHCANYARSGDDAHIHAPDISCTRLWYALAPANNTRVTNDGMLIPERQVSKDTAYVVEPLPFDAPEPVFKSGIIAKLPITNISVIRSPGDAHKGTLERLAQGVQGIPVTERSN